MKVTYLSHSGFLLEWEHSYWLFDYFEGEIPELNPEKELLVFCSHSHADHFSPAIFSFSEKHSSVKYIFSNELRKACKKLEKKAGRQLPEINFLKSRTDTILETYSGETLQIHTLQSTDCGCAFLIEYNGKRIYHAGDLHWWYWEGEPEDWNRKMTADYKKEMECLNAQNIDLAFTVLDPRQEKDYALGMNDFLKRTHTINMFPMHCWNDYMIIEQYLREYSIPEHTMFHEIQKNGQTFEIML